MWDRVRDRLSLCHGTLIEISPPDFVSAAAAAGFRRVSLRVQTPKAHAPGPIMGDHPMTTDAGLRRETRKRLDDTGIEVIEGEAANIGPTSVIAELEPFIASSADMGAVGVIPVFFSQTSPAQLLDQFGQFDTLAAKHGQKTLIEFIALSAVPSVGAAQTLIRASGSGNARIIVDSLHLTRSGGSAADIAAIDPALLHGAQINDGPAERPADEWWFEMSRDRRFLGDGAFAVAEMLCALPADLPIGVEVISQEFQRRGWAPERMARFAMDNARHYFTDGAGAAGRQ